VLAFIEDVGASGGYMLACAADESSAILFDRRLDRRGRRLVRFSQADGKARRRAQALYVGRQQGDARPFLPEKPEDVKRIKAIQKDIHTSFINLVKERRGAKLTGTDKQLFSGEFWTAKTAIELASRQDRRYPLKPARALRRQGTHAADYH